MPSRTPMPSRSRNVLRDNRPTITRARSGRELARWSTRTAVLTALQSTEREPVELPARILLESIRDGVVAPGEAVEGRAGCQGQGQGEDHGGHQGAMMVFRMPDSPVPAAAG